MHLYIFSSLSYELELQDISWCNRLDYIIEWHDIILIISDTKYWGTAQKTQIDGILIPTVTLIQWNFPCMNIIAY